MSILSFFNYMLVRYEILHVSWAVVINLFAICLRCCRIVVLFSSKVSRDFSPLFGFPFYYRDCDAMCFEPSLCALNELE